jgi:hypothetical protein
MGPTHGPSPVASAVLPAYTVCMVARKQTDSSPSILALPWFWIMTGSVGYLASLYAILLAMGHGIAIIGFPLVFVPLLVKQLPMLERLKIVSITALLAYMVLLLILVRNSYFPESAVMVLELFFILLITIPSFLIRAPLYQLLGVDTATDSLLIISGCLFLVLFWLGIRRVHTFSHRSQLMMLAVVYISIFITSVECYDLGIGIQQITAVTELQNMTVRDYYRVACGGINFGCNTEGILR